MNNIMNPEISVIIPIYNTEKYLPQCIESVLVQSYNNFELILVNDGSTDNSGRICDNYAKKDERIKVFHKKNGGVTSARAFGVEKAKGEYINFVDSDDTIPEHSLLSLIKIAQKNALDIITANYIKINGSKVKYKINFDNHLSIFKQSEYMKALAQVRIMNAPWAKLFKKELFDNYTFNLNREIVAFEDLIMNIRLALRANAIGYVNTSVYNYHKRENSASNTNKINLEYYKKITALIVQSFYHYKRSDILVEILPYFNLTQIKFLILDKVSFNYNDIWLQNNILNIKNLNLSKKEKLILLAAKNKVTRFSYLFFLKLYSIILKYYRK